MSHRWCYIDELVRKRMAERVLSRAPGFSQDDLVLEVDNKMLERATALYRERGEAMSVYNQNHSQQGHQKWTGQKKLPWDGKRQHSWGQGGSGWKKHRKY